MANDIQKMKQNIKQLITAVRPIAVMGVASIENHVDLLSLNIPFYDCPDDLVLYQDGMGHALTVGDIRIANKIFLMLALEKN